MMRALWIAICTAFLWLTWATDVHAQAAQQQFQLAYTRYQNGLYEEAADILRKLLAVPVDPQKDPERAEVYRDARPVFVACLFGIAAIVDEPTAKTLYAEADQVILDQYRQDPFYRLPGGYSPQVSDQWTRVYFEHKDELEALKDKLIAEQQAAATLDAKRQKLEAERLEKLEKMAAEERFVDTRSRVVAMIPFGVGQFQNGDIGWGVFFAASQTLTIATSVVSGLIAQDVIDTKCPDTVEENGQLLPIDCDALMDRFEIARAVNYASLATAGALIVTGIIQAQVVFEPERVVTRKRPIPPPVKITPVGSFTPNGGFFGLQGTF